MDTKTKEKVLKLFALALDQAAADGESENAAGAAVRLMRSVGAKINDLGIAPTAAPPPPLPWWSMVKINFGKYKGETLEDLAVEHFDYLIWVQENTTPREPFARALRECLAHHGYDDE